MLLLSLVEIVANRRPPMWPNAGRSPIGQCEQRHVNFLTYPQISGQFLLWISRSRTYTSVFLNNKLSLKVSGYYWILWFFDFNCKNFHLLNHLILLFQLVKSSIIELFDYLISISIFFNHLSIWFFDFN